MISIVDDYDERMRYVSEDAALITLKSIDVKYIYDFFGLTMVHGQLVLFVIEYDDEFKFKNYTNEPDCSQSCLINMD